MNTYFNKEKAQQKDEMFTLVDLQRIEQKKQRWLRFDKFLYVHSERMRHVSNRSSTWDKQIEKEMESINFPEPIFKKSKNIVQKPSTKSNVDDYMTSILRTR